MINLDETLIAALRPDGAPLEATDAPWSINDLDAAAWASRKAAEARRQAAKVQAWGDAEKARIDAVVTSEVARFERDAEFFEEHLAAFLRSEIDAGRKTKSLQLPGGTIKLTARQPRLDAEAFVTWAQTARPDLVRTKVEPDKANLKRVAELVEGGVVIVDGEVVPGATWEPQGDSVSFAVSEAS